MRKISFWGRANKWNARLITITGTILLVLLGIATGSLLNDLAVHMPPATLTLLIIIYFVGVFLYPSKQNKNKDCRFYQKQKTCDAILAASTFLLTAFIANNNFRDIQFISGLQASTIAKPILPADSTVKKYKSITAFSASLKNENGEPLKWKEKKKLLKEQVRAIKKAEGLSKSGETILVILSVIAALGLLYVVAALACGISCNGSAAGAIVVGVLGTAVVVFLLIRVIRSINRKKRKNQLQPSD